PQASTTSSPVDCVPIAHSASRCSYYRRPEAATTLTAPASSSGVLAHPPHLPIASRPLLIAALAVALLGARLLGAHFVAFFQLDEVSLAAGVAALARDSIGGVYRYGPQVGYYRLIEGLTLLLGGDLRSIPIIMITLSAVAGTVIPVCGLVAFPDLLTRAERWVLAGLLAVNPILWMSSTYGNTAMPSTALVVLAVTILSNLPGRAMEVAALALYGAAVLVRADAILAFPVVALLLHVRHGFRPAMLYRIAPLLGTLAGVYVVLFLTDPQMASTVQAVTTHLTNPAFPTRFWDYLLWSTSPFILVFAVLGARELLTGRRRLLGYVAAWGLPFFGFYFGSTTSPRYFVSTAFPVALCSAVGFVALASLVRPSRWRLTIAALALLATIHLFVGLGHFTPGSLRNLLTQSQFETQIGPLWTGAFLYKSYFTPRFLGRSVRQPGFGKLNGTQHALDTSLAQVASGEARGRTVAVLLGGWNGHVFHYYAHARGAEYISRKPGNPFNTETWMTLGGARLMSIRWQSPEFRTIQRLPVTAGDQVWVLAGDSKSEGMIRDQLPRELTVVAAGDTTGPLGRYQVVRSAP
ncbi:MAG: hypothetical protein ABR543_01095, partial [Gemmatimonadaceae bacterium]